MSTDSILNIVFFLVGLAIGLLQLYIAQRHFEHQQRQKMDELRVLIADIQQRVAVIQEVSSQRSFDVQDNLMDLIAKVYALNNITDEAVEKIKHIVSSALDEAGLPDVVEKNKLLEAKVVDALQASASAIVEVAHNKLTRADVSLTELSDILMELQALSEQELAKRLGVSPVEAQRIMRGLYKIAGAKSRLELIERELLHE